MCSSRIDIVCRGRQGRSKPPFRLPVEGLSLDLVAEALLPLHLEAVPGRPSHIQPLRWQDSSSPSPTPGRGPVQLTPPRVTAHRSGHTLALAGGSLRLRPAGGDTIACALGSTDQRRVAFPLLLEMAVIHALALEGIPVFHGAAFTCHGHAVLALGPSGAGKTTLAAAAIKAGGRVISDDSVMADGLGGALSIRPFRRDMQVRRGSRRLFPRPWADRLEQLANPVEPKWVLRREDARPCFSDVGPPDRIWVITLDRRLRSSRIETLSQAEALAALIQGSSPLYLGDSYPRERAALMPVLCALAERVPARALRLGKALVETPARELERLLTGGF